MTAETSRCFKMYQSAQLVTVLTAFLASVILLHSTNCTERGPDNIVGLVGGSVTLACERGENVTGYAVWSFIPPGSSSDEVPVPGRHSFSTSTYGRHYLTLEHLEFSHSGVYVCRSTPGSFRPTGAHVVMVAHRPHCEFSATGSVRWNDDVTMECSVTYQGAFNLTVAWFDPDGRRLAERSFPSSIDKVKVGLLTVVRQVRETPFRPHLCTATFDDISEHGERDDMAKNSPTFHRNNCSAPVGGLLVIDAPSTPSPSAASTAGRETHSVIVSQPSTPTLNPGLTSPTMNVGPDEKHRVTEEQLSAAVITAAVSITVAVIAICGIVLIVARRRCHRRKCSYSTTATSGPSTAMLPAENLAEVGDPEACCKSSQEEPSGRGSVRVDIVKGMVKYNSVMATDDDIEDRGQTDDNASMSATCEESGDRGALVLEAGGRRRVATTSNSVVVPTLAINSRVSNAGDCFTPHVLPESVGLKALLFGSDEDAGDGLVDDADGDDRSIDTATAESEM